MSNLMIFEGKEVEVFELNGQVLFNPYHCGQCLDLAESTVRNHLASMNSKQAILLKNSDVLNKDIRNLNNAGEKFLTESGVYKLILKSSKKEAEKFQDWVTDEVLPQIRQTGGYIPTNEEDDDEAIMAKALIIAQKTIERKNKIIQEQKPYVVLVKERIAKGEKISLTDITKTLGLKRGQISNYFKENGYLHKTQNEVNKKGKEMFAIYKEGNFNCIGVLEKGIDFINEHLEEIKQTKARKSKKNK